MCLWSAVRVIWPAESLRRYTVSAASAEEQPPESGGWSQWKPTAVLYHRLFFFFFFYRETLYGLFVMNLFVSRWRCFVFLQVLRSFSHTRGGNIKKLEQGRTTWRHQAYQKDRITSFISRRHFWHIMTLNWAHLPRKKPLVACVFAHSARGTFPPHCKKYPLIFIRASSQLIERHSKSAESTFYVNTSP